MQITRRFKFDAAHRLYGHEGKCKHVHGHSYQAEVSLHADALDSLGRVIDFAVMKGSIGQWIQDNWDHNILLSVDDPLLEALQHEPRRPYIMADGAPTAEHMAMCLHRIASRRCVDWRNDRGLQIRVSKVRIYETEDCWAEYGEG